MIVLKKIAITILLIGLCFPILSFTDCSRKNKETGRAGQVAENETIITDFTSAVESDITQLGDFVVEDNILVLYTGNELHIEIPASLNIKGIRSAFAHSSIISVVIPEQVEIIEWAFYNCYYLQSITVAPNNRNFTSVDGVLFNKAVTELVHFPQGKTGSYTIPSTITAIDWRFFSGCSSLTSISIPASISTIENAFTSCDGLTSITVDPNNRNFASADGVLFNKTMTEFVWFPNAKGGSYTIPNTITRIGDSAFSHRNRLTSVTIPNTVTRIGDYAFSNCTNLTSVSIPNSVTVIGDYAFNNCTRLNSITIPDSVTSIGMTAFSGSGLTAIAIPGSVTSIGDDAFSGCSSLTSINVDENNINYASADGVFFNKAKTELIYFPHGKAGLYSIPDTVTSIKDFAFSDREGLTTIIIPASLLTIGRDAFFNCTGLTAISVDGNNPNYASEEGVLFNKTMTELIRFPRGKTGHYTIPHTVTKIGNNAFAGSKGLTSVTITPNVFSIGDTAFAGTGLTSLTLPNTVESIGNGAFADNPRLTVVGLPNNYYEYGEGKGEPYFFYGCTGLQQILANHDNKNYSTVDGVLFNKDRTTLIRFPQGKTGSYTIPNTVTTISYKAFYNASGLTSINIPASVTSIGDFAFDGCTSLTSVNIPNNVISIGSYAFVRCTNLASVNIPASVTSIGHFAFYDCTSLRHVAVDSENKSFTMVNGMLLRKDKTDLNSYLAVVSVR